MPALTALAAPAAPSRAGARVGRTRGHLIRPIPMPAFQLDVAKPAAFGGLLSPDWYQEVRQELHQSLLSLEGHAAQAYAAAGTPLVILAGKEYGSGSSRDWAAKGTLLLGVRAVIAESYERIHRSNLIGMGVLPLQFADGESAESLGLTGAERISVGELDPDSATEAEVTAEPESGDPIAFTVRVRLDTANERKYFRHGGILHRVLRELR